MIRLVTRATKQMSLLRLKRGGHRPLFVPVWGGTGGAHSSNHGLR